MGLDNGTAIIDISKPTKPKYLEKSLPKQFLVHGGFENF